MLFFLMSAVTADALTCRFCGKEISGRYVEYRTNTKYLVVCADCNQRLPRCDACRLPTAAQNLLLYKGEHLCSDCAKEAKYCSVCDRRIQGRYVVLKESGNIYCQSCYDALPKCSVCGKPVRPLELDRSTGVCLECLKKLPRCAACGKPIIGSFYRFQFVEGTYCSDCMNNRPKCYTCGAPVGDRYWKFQDGREICDQCNRRAVIDAGQVRKIMQETEQLVGRLLGLKTEQPYTLHVEPLNNSSSLIIGAIKKTFNSDSPLNGSELGLFRRANNQSDIYLLYGLPPEILYETAAHEYAHAWQAENCPLDQSSELREGFAQWVATEILRNKGFKIALEKLEAREDSPYGTGYQRIKHVYQNVGRAQLLDYVKKARR